MLETIEIETGVAPRASVLWLHGLGADGHDFEPIVPELDLPDGLPVRFVFPHAPVQPVTINGGERMRAWYDVYGLGGREEDEAGIRRSQALVEELIERERSRGIEPARLVLAGFSQGGVMTLQTGLRHRDRLAGLLVLSAYLPLAATLPDEASAVNRDVPIFMAHGRVDDLIPVAWARRSADRLRELGYPVEWREYPIGHAVSAHEVRDVAAWLRRVLAAPPR